MSSPARKTVELFYDVVSPYAWIGFEVMTRYQHKWNVDLQLKPFFLGGVMHGSGNKAPAFVPNKAAYMNKDIPRLANHFHIPIRHPSNPMELMFEKGTLTAMRFVTAIDMKQPQHTESLSRELWMRAWSRDQPIFEPENLAEAAKKAGIDDSTVMEAMAKIKSPEVKDRLRKFTEEALEHGAFGAPTIIAHVDGKPEMVFGSDRFHILADLLGETYSGPLTELNKAKL